MYGTIGTMVYQQFGWLKKNTIFLMLLFSSENFFTNNFNHFTYFDINRIRVIFDQNKKTIRIGIKADN